MSAVRSIIIIGACATSLGALACSAPAVIPDDVPSAERTRPTPPAPPSASEVQEADDSVPEAGAPCATAAPNNKCGLDPQCGCANNETCDVTNATSGATSCVTAGGATFGRPCNQTGDCLAGLTCSYGACRPYCKTPRSKCGVAGADLCVEMLGTDGKPVTNGNVCTITCDPRVPTGVCGTNACHWFPTYYAPSKVSDCNFGGTVAALAPCQDTSDCQPALACINHPKYGYECERWCRIGQTPSDCGADSKITCKDVFGADAPVINGVKEGVCQD